MKSIKFGSVVFNLVDTINVDTTRLQATIYQGNYSVEQVIAATKDCNIIQMLEDGKIIGQYSGYTEPIAYTLNFLNAETPIISIELSNLDIISQINSLNNQITEQANTVTSIASSVSDLDGAVMALAEVIGGGEVND